MLRTTTIEDQLRTSYCSVSSQMAQIPRQAPVFSDRGDRLFWSSRGPTGEKIAQGLLRRTPGSENRPDSCNRTGIAGRRPPGFLGGTWCCQGGHIPRRCR